MRARRAGRRLPPEGIALLPVFAAGVDNFVAPPMLLALADHFDRSLGGVAAVVAAYSFAYGGLQLAWGFVSDRLGRLGAVRLGLALGAAATLAAALADDLTLVVALRALAGAAFAAVVPSTVTYVGDSVAGEHRARTLSDLVAVYSGAVAAGILLGGLASDVASWRVGFAASSGLSLVALAAQLRYARDAVGTRRSLAAFAASVARTAGATWPRAVALLGLVEGAALFGFLTFFPAALEAEGLSRRLAGLVVALYGVATALLTRPARRLSAAWPVGRTLGVGLLLGAVALGIAGASRSPAAIGASAVVLAAGLALAHPLLQAWATTVLPAERATTVGLFATGLFVGTALTTQLVAPFVAELGFGWTFTIGAGMAAGLAGMLVVSWQRFERREQLPADGLLPAPERATDP